MTDNSSNEYHSVDGYGVLLNHNVIYIQSRLLQPLARSKSKSKFMKIIVMAMTCLDADAFRHHQGSMNYSKRVEAVALKDFVVAHGA